MTFGEKLKKLRSDNRLTQEQLAEKLYVTRTAVSKWETGKGFPAIDSLKLISDLFGVSIDGLISDGDVENKRLLEEEISKRFYFAALACLALTTVFSVLGYFLNKYFLFGAGVSAVGYVVFGLLTKPKYKRIKVKRLVAAYIISRIAAFLLVAGIILVTVLETV